MSAPPVIAFTPVPLRRRADGWPAELQLRFIVALSQGMTPGEAARSVGKNRQNAYKLRSRPGAESFAAAWDEVVAYARSRPRPASPPLQAALPARPRAEARAPVEPRPAPLRRLPTGAEAEAIAARGAEAMKRASSDAAARRALDDMLDALYGPKSDKSDNCDSGKYPL